MVSEGIVEACFADFEARCGLSDGQSIADMGFGLLQLLGRDDRLAPAFSAARCGGLQSGLCALDNEVTLKLGKCAEQMEHQSAARGGCVHAFGQGSEADTMLSEVCHRFHKVLHGSAQAIEFPDNKRVAISHKGKRFIQAGAFSFGARNDILKHGLAACLFERIHLRFQLLLSGRDPRISNQSHEDSLVRFPVHKSTCPTSRCQAILADGTGRSAKRAFHGHEWEEGFFMARRQILTASFWSRLMAPPSSDREVAMYCMLTPDETEVVARKRTAAARLGYAVSLAYLRHPGRVRNVGEQPNDVMLAFLADQVDASASDLAVYDQRPQTRREHIAQIMARFGYKAFTKPFVREFVHWLTPSAGEGLRAEPLAISLIEELRRRRILIPARRTVELIVRHAIRRAENVRISALTQDLRPDHHNALRALIAPPESGEVSTLSWLKAASKSASVKSIKAVLDRLKVVRAIGLPTSLRQNISTSALDSLAGEGLRITVQNLRRMALPRLWAVLSAACLRLEEQLTDLALDMFDKLLGRSFRKAEQQSSDKASKLLMDIIRPLQSLKSFCREALTARLQTGDLNGMLDTANWDEIESATSAIETALGDGKPDKYTELIGKYQTARQFAPMILRGFSLGNPASARR